MNLRYEEEKNEGEKRINITNDVDRLLVHCDIAQGFFTKRTKDEFLTESDVIYSFVPDKQPGNQLSITVSNLTFIPLREGRVSRITMEITDQDDNPIDFNGERMSFALLLR